MSKFTEQRLQEAVYLKRGKNLFNKNNAIHIDGIGIGADGNMFSRADQRLYIVEITQKAEDITVSWTKTNSGSRKYALTNEIPNMNSTLPNYVATASTTGKLITTMQNNNYKYLVLSLTTSDNLDDLQIEYGSNATSYEAYVEKRLLDVRGEEIVNLDEMKAEIAELKKVEEQKILENGVKCRRVGTDIEINFGNLSELTEIAKYASANIAQLPSGYFPGVPFECVVQVRNSTTRSNEFCNSNIQ